MSRSGPLSPTQAAVHLLSAEEAGEKAAVLTIISHPDPTMRGQRILLTGGGDRLGSFQDPGMDKEAAALAARGLSGDPKVTGGLYPLPLAGDGEFTAYLELHHPTPEMVIVGAGHLAQPPCPRCIWNRGVVSSLVPGLLSIAWARSRGQLDDSGHCSMVA